MKDIKELIEFLNNTMSMSEVYQPAIILYLLEQNGTASKHQIAGMLSGYDESVQEYYQRVLMRWPKQTLTKHDIVTYDRRDKVFSLSFELGPTELLAEAKAICETKIKEWIHTHQSGGSGTGVDSSRRYRVLKAAHGRCELCGISAKVSPIDIDHIVPRSKANRYAHIVKDGLDMHVDDERNLQALCFRCNRAKRDRDSIDWRLSRQKLVRDKIPEIIRNSGRIPVTQRVSGTKFKDLLLEKLVEEHSELIADVSEDEVVDMIEVLLALSSFLGYSENEILDAVHRKRNERGGLTQGVLLIEILAN